ncbi:MAG TPA: hypothetical protein VH859_00160 [Candidatus Limnocylindria bacterium]|jgi:hypothetical protein
MPRANRPAGKPLLIAPLLAAAMLWPLAGSVAARGIDAADTGSATQTRPIVYDVSYPQCGRDLPEAFAFAIVGVNGGLVYAPNPCLGAPDDEDGDTSQLAWAGGTVQFYANTGNPGPRLSRYWPLGQRSPRVCSDRDPDTASCAYNYGWNAAADSYANAVAAYVSLGLAEADATRTPAGTTWWLDVETANSWRADARLNVAALQGAVDYLHSVDVAGIGFYSAPRMWQRITGGTDAFADYPSWVAGASSLEGARAACRGEGLTGGPVVMAQYVSSGLDTNVLCDGPAPQ